MEHRPSTPERPRPHIVPRVNGHVVAPVRTPPEQPAERVPTAGPRGWARYASIGMGSWLFISAFVWWHNAPSAVNTWVVGVLMVLSGLWGLRSPGGRLANTLLASWLILSTFLFFPSAATFWNNLFVGVAVLVLSFIPTGRRAQAA